MPPPSGGDEIFGDTDAGDATADRQPMRAAHADSPFEEPVTDFTQAAVTIEKPVGVSIETPPLAAETPTPWPEQHAESSFSPTDVANTVIPVLPAMP